MAQRRAPQGFGPAGGPLPPMAAAQAGGMPPMQPQGAGPGGPQMPRPPMPMGGPGQVPMAPPVQPSAGGPTSPMNIDSMLKTNTGHAGGADPSQPGGGAGAPNRMPLPPWGSSMGSSAGTDQSGGGDPLDGVDTGNMMGSGAIPPGAGAGAAAGNPAVMIKLLKSMGLV